MCLFAAGPLARLPFAFCGYPVDADDVRGASVDRVPAGRTPAPGTKGLHSFTSQLNLSVFLWDRGCA